MFVFKDLAIRFVVPQPSFSELGVRQTIHCVALAGGCWPAAGDRTPPNHFEMR